MLLLYTYIHFCQIYTIFFYSALKAITGSCLEAILDGIDPPILVSIMLIIIKIIAAGSGRYVFTTTPVAL